MWFQVMQSAAQQIGNVISTRAQGKAIVAQNNALLAQMGKQLNEINLQRAQTIQNTNAALFNIDVAKGQAQSQVQLQAAASGTMGASVKDAVATVNTVTDRQAANVYSQYNAQMTAYTNQIKAVGENTANSMTVPYAPSMGMALATQFAGLGGRFAVNSISGEDAQDSKSLLKDYFGFNDWSRQTGAGDTQVDSWKNYLGG